MTAARGTSCSSPSLAGTHLCHLPSRTSPSLRRPLRVVPQGPVGARPRRGSLTSRARAGVAGCTRSMQAMAASRFAAGCSSSRPTSWCRRPLRGHPTCLARPGARVVHAVRRVSAASPRRRTPTRRWPRTTSPQVVGVVLATHSRSGVGRQRVQVGGTAFQAISVWEATSTPAKAHPLTCQRLWPRREAARAVGRNDAHVGTSA